jgi:hypothetical protein
VGGNLLLCPEVGEKQLDLILGKIFVPEAAQVSRAGCPSVRVLAEQQQFKAGKGLLLWDSWVISGLDAQIQGRLYHAGWSIPYGILQLLE